MNSATAYWRKTDEFRVAGDLLVGSQIFGSGGEMQVRGNRVELRESSDQLLANFLDRRSLGLEFELDSFRACLLGGTGEQGQVNLHETTSFWLLGRSFASISGMSP